MTAWNVLVEDKTDKIVQAHLTRVGAGENGLSAFVDQAVRERVFWETVSSVQNRNADANPDEVQQIIDEAVDWARANRS